MLEAGSHEIIIVVGYVSVVRMLLLVVFHGGGWGGCSVGTW